jgi:hypothetical protein
MKKLLFLFICVLIVSCTEKNEPSYWKGEPYEKMFNEIAKHYFISSDTLSVGSVCDKKTKEKIEGNMEDVTALKKIIMTFLPFEPESSFESTYQNHFLIWDASKYEVSIMYNDNHLILSATNKL